MCWSKDSDDKKGELRVKCGATMFGGTGEGRVRDR